jgi:non-ribosomal peptide synthase protein (TIGR01720 family)
LLRYLSSHSGVLATRPQAEISFNYLGQMDQMASLSTAVALARESTGYDRGPDNLRCYLVDINSTVAGGRLAFEWTYSENVHRRATIARVADDFIVALRAIMASGGPGAVQRDAGPEIDADEFGWSEEDVRDIMDLMRKKR